MSPHSVHARPEGSPDSSARTCQPAVVMSLRSASAVSLVCAPTAAGSSPEPDPSWAVTGETAGLAVEVTRGKAATSASRPTCLLYTSDAADDLLCVDLGGRRI